MKDREGVDNEGPGASVPPPLIFFTIFVAGVILQFLFPLRFVNSLLIQLGFGLPIVALGFGLGGWAVRTLMKAGVDPRPESPVKSIVARGPFRFSRNPIYLSGIMILLGGAVAVDTVWILLLTPIGAVLLSVQIGREEQYLEGRFGEEYRNYKCRVRRWL